MKSPSAPRPAPPLEPRRSVLPAALACFALGAAVTGLWLHHPSKGGAAGPAAGGLSDATKDLLSHLPGPVTIRYYELLPAADDPVQAFAGRVAQLLGSMQDAAGGRLQVVTINTPAETNSTAAGADGIQVFNLDKGESDFFGLALSSGKNKESFARLDPRWENALEFDLDQAILRVATPTAAVQAAAAPKQADQAVVASVNQLIPDLNNTSTEMADQVFHDQFVKEITEASSEMDAQINAAQEKLAEVETNGTPADVEAAQKNLAQVQLASADKVKQAAAMLRERMAAFQQLKSAAASGK